MFSFPLTCTEYGLGDAQVLFSLQHEYIVQLSMISPGNAGGESGKIH